MSGDVVGGSWLDDFESTLASQSSSSGGGVNSQDIAEADAAAARAQQLYYDSTQTTSYAPTQASGWMNTQQSSSGVTGPDSTAAAAATGWASTTTSSTYDHTNDPSSSASYPFMDEPTDAALMADTSLQMHDSLESEPIHRSNQTTRPQQSRQQPQQPQQSRPPFISGMASYSGRGNQRGGGGVGRGRGGGRGGSASYNNSQQSSTFSTRGRGGGGFTSGYPSGRGGSRGASNRGGRGASRGGRGRGGWNQSYSGLNAYSDEPSVAAFSTTFKTDEMNQREMGEDYPEFDEEVNAGVKSNFIPMNSGNQFGAPSSSAIIPASVPPRNSNAAAGAAGGSGKKVDDKMPISTLPGRFRALFPYPFFNKVQSQLFHPAFYGDDNIVLAAPTGSGKTVIFELAVLRFFQGKFNSEEHEKALMKREEQGLKQTNTTDEVDQPSEFDDDGNEIKQMESSENEQDQPDQFSLPQELNPPPPPDRSIWKKRWRKALYISPLKSLCAERYSDWSKFRLHLMLNIVQVTGDFETPFTKLAAADIIITTPEKWDALSRRMTSSDKFDRLEQREKRLINSVGLVMVDEMSDDHQLNEPSRGAALEGLLSRMQMRKQDALNDAFSKNEPIANLRILALSATAPNAKDVAEWLQGQDYPFDNSHRPVPIEYHVYDYAQRGGNQFTFDASLNTRLMEMIRKHSEERPTLIFSSTRKQSYMAAKAVSEGYEKLGLVHTIVRTEAQKQALYSASQHLPEAMQALVRNGVAFHHGGLGYAERQLIEQLFVQGHLQVLSATTTLAQGVNLPAFCVIVKGTTTWNGKENVELDSTQVTQMIGRAGRPQFDKKGVAIVMTQTEKLRMYNCLLSGRVIESHLVSQLVEHINAEVAVGSMTDWSGCVRWLKSTFMYQRMKRDPKRYFGEILTPAQIDQRLEGMATKNLDELAQADLIRYHIPNEQDPTKQTFEPTLLSYLTARWYLSFNTAKLISMIDADTTFEDFLDLFSQSGEFHDSELRIKPGDKGTLNPFLVRRRKRKPPINPMLMLDEHPYQIPVVEETVQSTLPFTIPGGRINTQADKIKTLVQIRCMGLHDSPAFKSTYGLGQDMTLVFNSGGRIVKAMDEYLQQRAMDAMKPLEVLSQPFYYVPQPGHPLFGLGWISLKNVILFRKSIENQTFDCSPQIFAQFQRVGNVLSARLFEHAKSFADLARADERDIEAWTGRRHPFGQQILNQLKQLPQYRIDMNQLGYSMDTSFARLTITFDCPAYTVSDEQRVHRFVHLIVGSLKNELLFYKKARMSELPLQLHFDVALGTQLKAFMIDDKTGPENKTHPDGMDMLEYLMLTSVAAVISHEQNKRAVDQVGDSFDRLESSKRQPIPTETIAIEEVVDEPVVPDMKDEDRLFHTSLTQKEFCKHKHTKCQEGKCKHTCCKTRFDHFNPIPADGGAPRFTSLFARSSSSESTNMADEEDDDQQGRIDSPAVPMMTDDETPWGATAYHSTSVRDSSIPSRKRPLSHTSFNRSSAVSEEEEKQSIMSQSTTIYSTTSSRHQFDPFRQSLAEEMSEEGGSSLVANKRIRLSRPPNDFYHQEPAQYFTQLAQVQAGLPVDMRTPLTTETQQYWAQKSIAQKTSMNMTPGGFSGRPNTFNVTPAVTSHHFPTPSQPLTQPAAPPATRSFGPQSTPQISRFGSFTGSLHQSTPAQSQVVASRWTCFESTTTTETKVADIKAQIKEQRLKALIEAKMKREAGTQ